MLKIKSLLKNLVKGEKGQGMVEYGLIIGLIAIVVIGILMTMGGQLQTIFQNISSALAI